MMRLLERNIAAIQGRLVILTPTDVSAPEPFNHLTIDERQHTHLLKSMQRLRGNIYVEEGAVQASQLVRGRHVTPQDDKSWHLLMVDDDDQVTGCIWYLEHEMPATVEQLRVEESPLSETEDWRPRLRRAVEADIAQADAEHLPYAEVGGWAVSHTSKCPADGFLLAVGAYSLSRILGGAIGLTTATLRHSSAGILRRLGLARFEVDGEPTPAYFDPKYGCEMELLRFDSRESNPKYNQAIEMLKGHLAQVSVVSATGRTFQRPWAPQPVLEPALCLA